MIANECYYKPTNLIEDVQLFTVHSYNQQLVHRCVILILKRSWYGSDVEQIIKLFFLSFSNEAEFKQTSAIKQFLWNLYKIYKSKTGVRSRLEKIWINIWLYKKKFQCNKTISKELIRQGSEDWVSREVGFIRGYKHIIDGRKCAMNSKSNISYFQVSIHILTRSKFNFSFDLP
jgi:hypothetical protein